MEREGKVEADVEDAEVEANAGVEAGLSTLLASATLARLSANARDAPTDDLLAITQALHDIIFDLKASSAGEVQSAIVEMCESWWLAECTGAEYLVPNMVMYLLKRAVGESATAEDIGALYSCRAALELLDLNDPSVAGFVGLLHRLTHSPAVLSSAEGQALLAFIDRLVPAVTQVRLRASPFSRASLLTPPSAPIPNTHASAPQLTSPPSIPLLASILATLRLIGPLGVQTKRHSRWTHTSPPHLPPQHFPPQTSLPTPHLPRPSHCVALLPPASHLPSHHSFLAP